MPDGGHRDKDMEFLSRAIVNAIAKSGDVREALRRISETDESYGKSFMVFMLKVRNLVESIGAAPRDGATDNRKTGSSGTKTPTAKTRKARDMRFVVDGKAESPGEIAFREYVAGHFDQDAWLKKHGLFFND